MKIVLGVAELHDRGSEIAGQTHRGGAGQTHTKQVVVFDIDGQMIQLKTSDLFPIKDGDTVGAAGKIKNGVINARAAVNVTRGATAKSYWSLAGGKPVQTIFFAMLLTLFVITFPAAVVMVLIYFMDTGGANKALKLVQREIKKASRQGKI